MEVMSRMTIVIAWSLAISSSMRRMELRAVVWFLPSSFPMSLRERLVSWRIRYMAICLPRVFSRERLTPLRSSGLRL